MAKPPKDPTTPPSKPAARRAPRNGTKPTARRATAAPTTPAAPAPTTAPATASPKTDAPKAAAAKPARSVAATRAAPTRAKAAGPKPKAPARRKAATPPKPAPRAAKAWTIGAIVAAAGAGLAAFLTRGRIATLLSRDEGHVPTDLLHPDRDGLAKHGDERAPAAFRPDMDAPMTAAEREALRPATGPAPSLTENRGTTNAQTGPAN